MIKRFVRRALNYFGLDLSYLPSLRPGFNGAPDAELYKPLYSPWLGQGEFIGLYGKARPYTLVSVDRCWVLYRLCFQAMTVPGDVWECGVYRGGTAALIAEIIAGKGMGLKKTLRLFDTFKGMPPADADKDWHKSGDLADTSLQVVQSAVGHPAFVKYHVGLIPETFTGLEDHAIAFAHIDVDIYQSVIACCEFIYPRLSQGGFMLFDDYGFPTCPGARRAVDEFFGSKPEAPLCLPTGQAVVFKSNA